MYVPLTIAVLGLLTAAMLILRSLWWRLPGRRRTALLVLAAMSATLPVISIVTKWSTTSDVANALLHWIALAGYELILIRFSLLRPQWLTSLCAVVLFVPMLGASLLLPLTEIFHRSHNEVFEIGGPYVCERSPWNTTGAETPGFSLTIYYRPRLVPFLRHQKQQSAFNADQCEASASMASILWGTGNVLFHCPPRPGQTPVEHVLPLN